MFSLVFGLAKALVAVGFLINVRLPATKQLAEEGVEKCPKHLGKKFDKKTPKNMKKQSNIALLTLLKWLVLLVFLTLFIETIEAI